MLNIESENGTSLDNQIENADQSDDERIDSADEHTGVFDFTHVHAIARIAMYDDLRSAPRVTEIKPAPTAEYIEHLASTIYEQARAAGGTIPYTVVREVSENFIHARFAEIIVSILDDGNTIRFADQGPGIHHKERAQLPGFTSAVEPMKRFIRGVGSGLPIVKEYLDLSHGTITIEDNLGTGSVVTVSMTAPNNDRLKSGPEAVNERALAKRGAQHEDTSEDDTEHPPAAHPDAYLPSYPDMQGAYRGPDSAYPAAAPGYPPAAPSYTATPATPYPTAASPYPIAQPPYSESMAPAYPGAAPVQPYDQRYPAAANQLGYTSPGARTGDTHGTSVYGAPAQWHQNPYASAHGNVGALVPPLTQRERDFLPIFLSEGALGVTDISKLTGVAPSSTYVTLSKLEQAGLIEKTVGQKRILTDLGYQVANSL